MRRWDYVFKQEGEDSYRELFPNKFGQRLERLLKLAGMSWEQFAGLLGVELHRVMEWRDRAIPTGGEVWHIMRLTYSVPGGMEGMLPEAAASGEQTGKSRAL